MPKTAGSSFRAALEEHFGAAFRHDYGDYPLASPPSERHRRALEFALAARAADFAGVACIHGHFLPCKYLLLADRLECRFVTWLREPLARLASHYDYWQRSYDPASGLTSLLHRRVVEEGWSLERFCLAPELRNVYTQFLWGFPLEGFDFIGISESYEEDLRYFSTESPGNSLPSRTLNRRPEARSESLSALSAGPLRDRVSAWHGADMALYERALALRKRRAAASPGALEGARPGAR